MDIGAQDPVERVADRLVEATTHAFEILAVYVGDRLGWYDALAMYGPLTSGELAQRTGTAERYTREWLEQQTTTGFLVLEPAEAPADRRFRFDPAAREVLTDERSLAFLRPLARMVAASASQLPALLEAYRVGDGVSWAAFGADARESQAELNRPFFEQRLAPVLAACPEVDATLRRPGSRVADVACGFGWSTLALAAAYPDARFVGYDVDAPSIEAAQRTARELELDARVVFRHAAAEDLAAEGPFDAVFMFEALHDLPDPVGALGAIHAATRAGSQVVIMDEATADDLVADGDMTERLLYGYSLFVCLPDGMSTPGSAGTGTVMRPAMLRRYALAAGFSDVAVLPATDVGLFRFHLLRR